MLPDSERSREIPMSSLPFDLFVADLRNSAQVGA